MNCYYSLLFTKNGFSIGDQLNRVDGQQPVSGF